MYKPKFCGMTIGDCGQQAIISNPTAPPRGGQSQGYYDDRADNKLAILCKRMSIGGDDADHSPEKRLRQNRKAVHSAPRSLEATHSIGRQQDDVIDLMDSSDDESVLCLSGKKSTLSPNSISAQLSSATTPSPAAKQQQSVVETVDLLDDSDDDDADSTTPGQSIDASGLLPAPAADAPLPTYAPMAVVCEERLTPSSQEELQRARTLIRLSHQAVEKGAPEHVLEQVVTYKYSIPLKWRSFARLFPGNWLDDEIINFYVGMLQERDDELRSLDHLRPSHYFSTFFMSKMKEGSTFEYGFGQVKKWSKKFNSFALSKVFVPINIDNSHWVLLIIFMQERVVRYFDSLGDDAETNEYLLAAKEWLKREYTDKKETHHLDAMDFEKDWTFINTGTESTPQQTNGCDCGMFVAMFIDFYSDSLPLTIITQQLMPMFREKVAVSIMNGKISYTKFHTQV